MFRSLWIANVVTALGTWMQNTGAGWLMTSLSPNALSVSLVQAATITPALLLALSAGALTDTLGRRRFLIATQAATVAAASVLARLTYAGLIDAAGLIALMFAIGVGSAMVQPAWNATVPEIVPRQDPMQAIVLNGVGFNLAHAFGPALGGALVLFGGPALAFSLSAVSFLADVRRPAGLAADATVRQLAAGKPAQRHARRRALYPLGLQATMAGAAAFAFAVRGYSLDHSGTTAPAPAAPPAPEDPAPELASMLPRSHGQVLETMRYRVAPVDRAEFLDAMLHVQHARGRTGTLDWRLYEDVAHPDG